MMCIGMFMAVLDVQVVATSLPTIEKALRLEPDAVSWIQTTYLTAEVVAIPLTGVLTQLLGMRWLFVIAVLLFTVSSIGCAASGTFIALIAWRATQGFFGGTLIPAVFAAVFILFPFRHQGVATTIAGVLAVLAPTTGPVVGGWITQTYSWHWLFLVNVLPGLLSALGALVFLPRERLRANVLGRVDLVSLILMAASLVCIQVALKEAPQRGWASIPVIALMAVSLFGFRTFIRRTRTAVHPLVPLDLFRDRDFAIGSLLSFVCGVGLFGSVYLMPVFLGLVRDLGAFETGKVMLVTGLAQLATAPIAVALERRIDARWLALFGFATFSMGCAMSIVQTVETDFDGMLWPQIVRGGAVMFCLLAPTRLALGHLAPDRIPGASGLFNLMRNLGGAIGLALIDTIIYGRIETHGSDLVNRLASGDLDAARIVGLPLAMFTAQVGRPLDEATKSILGPMIERAALTQSLDEAWALVALVSLAALAFVPLLRRRRARE
jgi:DHA2 family multidrug resistance protein